jgi:hypothetical protein
MKMIASLLLLLGSGATLAVSPFDGSWKIDLKSVNMTGKPDVYLLAKGEYACSSCLPDLQVKADGAEHTVADHTYYDTAMVKVTGPHSIEITLKKGGKEFAHMVDTVSADGNTLTSRFRNHIGDQEVTGTVAERRVAAAPAGSHPVSGTWQQQTFDAGDAVKDIQYEMTADGFHMSWAGQSYDAKFDGKEYSVNGDQGKTTVVLKKIDARTVEESDRRDGKIVDEFRMTVADNGRTIFVRDEDLDHDQITTYTLLKQP